MCVKIKIVFALNTKSFKNLFVKRRRALYHIKIKYQRLVQKLYDDNHLKRNFGASMSAVIKTPEEIEKRVAGRLAADVLEMIEPHVVP